MQQKNIYQKYSKEENIMGLFDKFSKKYNINSEDNIPQRVYGVPSPTKVSDNDLTDKYEVSPEENVPQKVYGVMDPEKFKLDVDKRNKEKT